jgi:cytochrome c553
MKLLARLLLAASLAVTSQIPVTALASEQKPVAAPKADLAKGEASFGAVCVACHGADGNSPTPANPKLAQQHPEYIISQLQAFKSGKRSNAVMQGFAATLSDEDMKNIAYWTAEPLA